MKNNFLQLRNKKLSLAKTIVVGIVNTTPDSFSDGGEFIDKNKAIDHALSMVDKGADIIDIGAESTKPNSKPVLAKNQLDRLVPVIEGIKNQTNTPISIDTGNAEVIKHMDMLKIDMINDVYALQQQNAFEEFIKTKMAICIMHMQNTPKNMQKNPSYKNVVFEVFDFLKNKSQNLINNGIDKNKIAIDPGFGFGKTLKNNLNLMKNLQKFEELKLPIYIGVSRKSMLGKIINEEDAKKRMHVATTINTFAILNGANIIRTHDVLETMQSIKTIEAIQNGDL
jgi:dihydropteroate synthase